MTDQSQALPDGFIWWKSRTIWWGIVCSVCNIAGSLGFAIRPEWRQEATDILLNAASLVAVLMAIYSHHRAIVKVASDKIVKS